MNRQLPIAVIDGIRFCVDVARDELWQQDAPQNRIPFSVFHQRKDGYTFLYNLKARSVPKDKEDALNHYAELVWVTLPALMELDPEGIALRYDIPFEALCPDREHMPPQYVTADLHPLTRQSA